MLVVVEKNALRKDVLTERSITLAVALMDIGFLSRLRSLFVLFVFPCLWPGRINDIFA